MARRELRLPLGGVEEREPRELDGAARRVDRALEAQPDDVRDEAAVIEVRMREEERIDRLRVVRERDAIPDHVVRAPLEHAAVDENARAIGLEQVLRTGHGACRAEEMDATPRIMPRYHHARRCTLPC